MTVGATFVVAVDVRSGVTLASAPFLHEIVTLAPSARPRRLGPLPILAQLSFETVIRERVSRVIGPVALVTWTDGLVVTSPPPADAAVAEAGRTRLASRRTGAARKKAHCRAAVRPAQQ